MAAISIVSGTSLNAFFHPCENLQSIAIQRAWRSANPELLSCIAKTELYYQKAEKVGPGQRPLLSLERTETGWEGAMGREAYSCDGWRDRLCSSGGNFTQTSHWHLSSTSSISGQEVLQGIGTATYFAENLLLSQLRYGWIPSTASWRAREADQISWYFGRLWVHNIW